MQANQNTVHDKICESLPEWGPDVPGTPVLAHTALGSLIATLAWREGWSPYVRPDGILVGEPNPWGSLYTVARLVEDGSVWPEVSAEERKRLSKALVGARAWTQRDGLGGAAEVAEVGNDGWMYVAGGRVFAAPIDPVRIHPGDLARAREKAQQPLPEEPPVRSVALDRDGDAWQRVNIGWAVGSSGIPLPWAELHRMRGPLTVIHRAEP